jgi:hypothetical protein
LKPLFGRYATTMELMVWRNVYETGIGLADIGQRFINSNEFMSSNPELSSTAHYLQAMARRGLGRNVTQAELDSLVLNLETLTVTMDGVSQELNSGMLSAVVSVDATGLTDGMVSFVGDSDVETYVASPVGDTIRGAGGGDQLVGGAGADHFIFESTAAANGLDVITGFQLGMADRLDFSSFLNVTGTGNIGAVDAKSSAAVVWASSDVLVVAGYALTTAGAIAGLFGDDLAFAAPTQ